MDAADESRATHVREQGSAGAPISRRWSRSTRARWVALGLVAGLVAGAGGFAVAAIPDAGTEVFHGCVNRATGLLRVIDPSGSGPTSHCVAGGGLFAETPITWNQTGPQGLPGSPGTPGAKGDKGDPGTPGSGGGLPTALTASNLVSTAVGTGTSLVSLDLPAGRYLVTARVNLALFSVSLTAGGIVHQGQAVCGVASDSDVGVVAEDDQTATGTGFPTSTGVLDVPITLEAVVSLAVPTTIDVHCTTLDADAPVFAQRSSVVALAVAP